jgi:hypothetical protein
MAAAESASIERRVIVFILHYRHPAAASGRPTLARTENLFDV